MNINQIMNIFNWDIKTLSKEEVNKEEMEKTFRDMVKYMMAIVFSVHKEGVGVASVYVMFNNMTSEVYGIEIAKKSTSEYWLYQGYEAIPIFPANKIDSIDIMIDKLNELVGKEPDVFLPIDMDIEAIAKIDNEAAELGITRNDYITKILLEYINKGS